jgi:uncharacterized protein (DUF3084 family)
MDTREMLPRLSSARLQLRPFAPDDAATVSALLTAPEISATTLNLPYP